MVHTLLAATTSEGNPRMWDWSVFWPAVASVFGAGGFLAVTIQELRKWRSGKAQAERRRNNDLKATADQAAAARAHAEALRDWEATRRRQIAEHASHLRRIALEHGVPLHELPPFPAPPERPQRGDYH
ncbi:hypothetical protein [Nesterenkonia suensis]